MKRMGSKDLQQDSFQIKYKSIKDFYQGRRCLLTGHTGFKGAWMSLFLHTLGAKITGYALEPPSIPNLFDLSGAKNFIEDVRADIRDLETLNGIVENTKPEIIFHFAAQSIVRLSYDQPKDTFDINVGGTVNLLEVLKRLDHTCVVVVVTSDKCYENREWMHPYRENDQLGGNDLYSASKAATEIICSGYVRSFLKKSGVRLATARAGNVIGGGDWGKDRIIPDIIRSLNSDKVTLVRRPSAVRPWQHVLEPLYGYILLGEDLWNHQKCSQDNANIAWNFGPDYKSCKQVHVLVDSFLNHYGAGKWKDISGENQDDKPEANFLTLDWHKAYHCLGWAPRWGFNKTIQRTSSWYSQLFQGYNPLELCLDDIQNYLSDN